MSHDMRTAADIRTRCSIGQSVLFAAIRSVAAFLHFEWHRTRKDGPTLPFIWGRWVALQFPGIRHSGVEQHFDKLEIIYVAEAVARSDVAKDHLEQ